MHVKGLEQCLGHKCSTTSYDHCWDDDDDGGHVQRGGREEKLLMSAYYVHCACMISPSDLSELVLLFPFHKDEEPKIRAGYICKE